MDIYIFSVILVYVSFGILLGVFIYAELIKRKYKKSRQEAIAAYVDALTGLGNRYKFNKVMYEMIKHPDKKFALCFLDLDDFKQINDNLGHDAGDELLIELGKRLKKSIVGHGEVFRLGGDEYALIITGADSKLEVETIVKRVQRNVVEPMLIHNTTVNLEYSLGIARFPEDSVNASELVNFADTAMYFVKESGKSSYYFHNEALKSQAENNRRMENELKAAYKNNEFGIDYQPRIDLKEHGRIWLETFFYWNHPMIGKLRAEYFLKYAETTGLVIELDEYIIQDSIRKLKEFKTKGYSNVFIAINLSLRHFKRKDFIDRICNILAESSEENNNILFQITEEIDVLKVEQYKVLFEKIKKYGVKISINNFGINYNKMDLLNRLKIDEIKISADYLTSNSIFNEDVLKDIVVLSKDLGYEVLVSKISDETTFKKVIKYPVNRVQGNYIYPVVGSDELHSFFEEYSKKSYVSKITRKSSEKKQ